VAEPTVLTASEREDTTTLHQDQRMRTPRRDGDGALPGQRRHCGRRRTRGGAGSVCAAAAAADAAAAPAGASRARAAVPEAEQAELPVLVAPAREHTAAARQQRRVLAPRRGRHDGMACAVAAATAATAGVCCDEKHPSGHQTVRRRTSSLP
jgi:hypothetical protein